MPPGPGQYGDDRDAHYKKLSGSKMGTSVRKAEFLKTASHGMPESSKYSLYGFTNDPKSGGSKFSFGKDSRFGCKEDGKYRPLAKPGPGHY